MVAVMILVFGASGDQESARHSSRIIGPLVRWLFPHLTDETVNQIVFLARKCAHLTEFGVLAWLFWRALRKPVRNDPRPWLWRQAGFALMWVMLYAASDEFHQSFVPTREARIHDVLIDSIGGVLGLLTIWALGRWRKRW